MPFLVEVMSPEGTSIRVGLIITFTVQAFEEVRTWFTLLGFQIQGVGFEVCLAIPSKMSVISDLREFPEGGLRQMKIPFRKERGWTSFA